MIAVYRDHMGSDLEVVNDARISFSASSKARAWNLVQPVNPDPSVETEMARVPVLEKGDIGLIKFLARGCKTSDWEAAMAMAMEDGSITSKQEAADFLNHIKRMPTHWTPFGHQMIKLRVKAPVPVRTHCFKSKIGFVENEESRRYIKSVPEIYMPQYRSAPEEDIKQGSGGPHPDADYWLQQYKEHTDRGVQLYLDQIEAGVAPEQARFSLPQGAMVNWVWTGSLYAYAEFFNKRSDRSHAQGEVADVADEVSSIIRPLFPVSWAALTD